MTAAGRVGVSGNLLLQPDISLPQTDTDTTAMTAAGRAGVSVETYYCGRVSACHRQTQGHHGNDCGWACRRQWNLLLQPDISLPQTDTDTTVMTAA